MPSVIESEIGNAPQLGLPYDDSDMIPYLVNGERLKKTSPLNFGASMYVSGTLTSSQIRSLDVNSGVTVIPAAGTNTVIHPLFVVFRYNYIAPEYNFGSQLALYAGITAVWVELDTLLITGTQDYFYSSPVFMSSQSNTNAVPLSLLKNKDIIFKLNVATAVGNGNGTLDYKIWYRIITL